MSVEESTVWSSADVYRKAMGMSEDSGSDSEVKRLFREDGMVQRLILGAQEVSAAAHKALEKAMAHISGERDPDPLDYVHDDPPRIRRQRERPMTGGDRALWISLASLVVTIGGMIFWTGRFTAVSEIVREEQQKQASEIKAGEVANARQDVTLGIIGQQYAEINRRLGSIETKVDDRH